MPSRQAVLSFWWPPEKPLIFNMKTLAFLLFCFGMANANPCRFNKAKWTNPNMGPKVTQPNTSDPTKVLVSWDRMLTHPECIYSCTINVWRKDIDSQFTNVRKVDVQQLTSTSFLVDNIEPCTDLMFMMEFSDSESFSLTKVKSGETKFRTEAQPSLINRDGSGVKVGYLYKNTTSSHDLRTAIIKLDKDRYIKYPNCVGWIEISGRLEVISGSPTGTPSKPVYDSRPPLSPGRTKRTIGQLPRSSSTSSSSSSTSTFSQSSYSSTTNTAGQTMKEQQGADINQKVFPPFRGLNGVSELSVTVQPCKTYRFTLDVMQDNRKSLGKIENVILPPLARIEGMRLPPIQSVLRLKETLTTIKIDMEPDSPVPPSCLIPFIDAVDSTMKVLQDLYLSGDQSRTRSGMNPGHADGIGSPACSRSPSVGPGSPLPGGGPLTPTASVDPNFLKNSQMLRDAGCTCWNTTAVNVTSSDQTVLTKHREVLGQYVFEGQMKADKPLFVKRNVSGSEYIYWNNKTKEWWVTDTLNATKPTMRSKAGKDLVCVSNVVSGKQLQFWERQSSFVGWSDDNTFNVTCVPTPVKAGAGSGPGFPDTRSSGKVLESEAIKQLKQHGCVCQTSAQVNLSSTDSRTMKDHKEQMGLYTFEGQWYENHPYYTKNSLTSRDVFYLFWDKSEQTWYIAQQLGQKLPLLKMEPNVNTKCPGDPTLKFWERKNLLGSWGTDETMTLKCHGNNLLANSGQVLRDDDQKKELLRQAGCKCYSSLHVNISSTDSRTIRKHGDELGEYTFEGKLHEGKPYYVKSPRVMSGKKYYVFWEPESRTWWLGDQLGSRNPSMKMNDDTDLLCPADPPTKKSKAWMRKNLIGVWSDDDSTKVNCMMH